MHDDYLWNGPHDLKGALEATEVLELEQTLAPLRYQGQPLRLPASVSPQPVPQPARVPGWVVPSLVAVGVAAALLLWLGRSVPPTDVASVAVSQPEPAMAHEPTPVEPMPVEPMPVEPMPAESTPVEPTPVESVSVEPTPVTEASTPSSSRARRRRRGSTRGRPRRAPSVDCLLDASKCDAPEPQPEPKPEPKPEPRCSGGEDCAEADPSLPDALTPNEIRAGMQRVLPQIKACGRTYGVRKDTRMKVKLLVAGESGTVSSARVQQPWTETPLGQCVARMARRASFPRFRKSRLGVVYPVTFAREQTATDPGDEPKDDGKAVTDDAWPTIRVRSRACAVAHDVEPGTKVLLTVKVSAAGRAKSVRVAGEGSLSQDAKRCLVSSIKKARFRPTPSGVQVRFPMSL